MKRAIVIGAGRIGRGFITKMLLDNHIDVVFFEANRSLYEKMKEVNQYTIHVLGYPEMDTNYNNFKTYFIEDIENMAKEIEISDYIFTAVGGKNMVSLGKTIAQAIQLVDMNQMEFKNIVTCENWIHPAQDLKESLLQELEMDKKRLFSKKFGVSEAVVMTTGTGNPNPEEEENELDTWIQNQLYLPIDRQKIKGEIPNLTCLEFIDDFGDLLTQKLYTNNTSVGAVAFLGRLKGFRYVAEAANDPQIEKILDQIYDEINEALIKGMGINPQSQYRFSKRAKEKYQDRLIVDELTRIAKDPIRKLAPTDRLIGPAKLALSVGLEPKAIALAIAAALYYEDDQDESAVKLKKLREEQGIEFILETVCQLEESDPLYSLVLKSVKIVKEMVGI